MINLHTFPQIPVGEPIGHMPGGLVPAELNPRTGGAASSFPVSSQPHREGDASCSLSMVGQP